MTMAGLLRTNKQAIAVLVLLVAAAVACLSCLSIPSPQQRILSNNNRKVTPFGPSQCIMDVAERYPSGTAAWQQGVPNFIIAGAPKAGTTTVSKLVRKHPTVFGPSTKELGYFRKLSFLLEANNTLSVAKARQFLYSKPNNGYPIESIQMHPHAISFDATPSYLYYSSTIMPLVFCAFPWIKIITLLRDPVERFYSSFRYDISRNILHPNESFAKIVQQELMDAKRAGLNAATQVAGGDEELEAWHRYQRHSRKGWLGKGLYDVQFRHLFKAMQAFQKNIQTDVLIVATGELKLEHSLKTTHDKLLHFLGLHPTSLPFTLKYNVGKLHNMEMPLDVRQRLEAFYGPYNARLNSLLADFGSDLFLDTYEQNNRIQQEQPSPSIVLNNDENSNEKEPQERILLQQPISVPSKAVTSTFVQL